MDLDTIPPSGNVEIRFKSIKTKEKLEHMAPHGSN